MAIQYYEAKMAVRRGFTVAGADVILDRRDRIIAFLQDRGMSAYIYAEMSGQSCRFRTVRRGIVAGNTGTVRSRLEEVNRSVPDGRFSLSDRSIWFENEVSLDGCNTPMDMEDAALLGVRSMERYVAGLKEFSVEEVPELYDLFR